MSYSREYLAELYCRVNIVEVIGNFLPLQRRGTGRAEYVASCPLGGHRDKTPSFVVHSAKQIYHCFGCGHAGTAVTFLMKQQQMTYQQAISWLARHYRFYPKQWRADKKKRAQKSK